MKTISLSFILSVATALFAGNTPEIYSKECIIRDGMPNFFVKAESSQDVKVAYLGGSITAQNGYRVQTLDWFKNHWQKQNFFEINAAIGGTGSQLGAFRVAKDVLQHDPDLVFIEFAVNDYGSADKDPNKVIASLEGIVRQIIKHNPQTDICFIYTLTHKSIDDIKSGKYPLSTIAHEKVADHYGIPSINMGLKIIELENAGKLVMKGEGGTFGSVLGDLAEEQMPVNEDGKIVFAKDGVHPYSDSGHIFYTQAIKRSINKLTEAGTPQTRTICEALNKSNLENAKMIDIGLLAKGDGWFEHPWDNDLLPLYIQKFMPKVKYTCLKGDSIEFRFKGSAFGLFDIMGPTGGNALCYIDNELVGDYNRFDSYCSYYRMNSFLHQLSQEGEYDVRIELGNRLTIDEKEKILAQRNIKIDNPEKYSDNCLYAGMIMMIGDIITVEPILEQPEESIDIN